MNILAVETSCDETAAAVLRDGRAMLSNVVASQIELHRQYGGVFPEMASRQHVLAIMPVVQQALTDAGVGWDELDAVAVTRGPGLAGSLLVGMNAAKGAAWARNLPLVGVNHLEGHIYSNWIEAEGNNPDKSFPVLVLIVSGGHSELILMTGHGQYQRLGGTIDDAAGEAFDKVAKLYGLGYPGGVAVSRLAARGDPRAMTFPRPRLHDRTLDFSFSGLKTAVVYFRRDHQGQNYRLEDLCASFQEAVVDVLAVKAARALERTGARTLAVCGGVACNRRLRERMTEVAEAAGAALVIPSPSLCTDNAVMVAASGTHRFLAGHRAGPELDAVPTWDLEDL